MNAINKLHEKIRNAEITVDRIDEIVDIANKPDFEFEEGKVIINKILNKHSNYNALISQFNIDKESEKAKFMLYTRFFEKIGEVYPELEVFDRGEFLHVIFMEEIDYIDKQTVIRKKIDENKILNDARFENKGEVLNFLLHDCTNFDEIMEGFQYSANINVYTHFAVKRFICFILCELNRYFKMLKIFSDEYKEAFDQCFGIKYTIDYDGGLSLRQ